MGELSGQPASEPECHSLTRKGWLIADDRLRMKNRGDPTTAIPGAATPGIAFHKGNNLRRGMRDLGNVTLHTFDEVVAVLGRPNALSSIGNGVELAQWMAGGYHVAMSFGPDGKCLGIDSEVSV